MSQYLTTIQNNTTKLLKPNHPRHKGVTMQAHHILSKDGVKRSGLGDKLEKFGYDINNLKNLAFIPSTLQGACHLGVQPHRGNHSAEFEEDDETMHPKTYHQFVEHLLKNNKQFIEGNCSENRAEVYKKMNDLSKYVLGCIQNRTVKLTSVAEHFDPTSATGCAGLDNIPGFKAANCPMGRNHHKDRPNLKQASEGISFPKSKTPYTLKPGE
jgi:hypothetical protein